MAEVFSTVAKEADIQVQEAQSPKQDVPKETHSNTHCIKVPEVKDKEIILKAARDKQLVIYGGTPIRLSDDFSAETLQSRRKGHNLFKIMKRGKKKKPTTKNTVPRNVINLSELKVGYFPR